MENTSEVGNHSRGINSLPIETDFSIYTLQQLLKARYWVDAESGSARGRCLEKEIHKRCAYIRRRFNRKTSRATGSGARFRPYGFIFGVISLSCSIGPFVAVKLLDVINVLHDATGDQLTVAGVWAILTLPFALPSFMIGGIMDAGRVVRWFHLAGRPRRAFPL
jgi:hypothetical protein